MSAPLSLPGYIDDAASWLDGYGTAVDYILEQNPELMHPRSVWTYAKMRHDPQLAAILSVFLLAIERGKWSIDGTGCRDEVTARIANDLGLPIKGYNEPDPDDPTPPTAIDTAMRASGARRRGFTWSKHLATAAKLSLTFGHAPFAQQWILGDDGMYQLAVVQERMPQTIYDFLLNNDGTLKAAVQGSTAAMADAPKITTANHQLVWYAREREGSNYFGTSIMRPSFQAWLIKDEMMRVHATSIRRFGMGIPYIQDQPNATPAQSEANQRAAQSMRAGATGGGSVPYGAQLKITGMTGSVPDAVAFIQQLDRYMTRSTLTSLLDMATAERGNRSLGETVMQLMIYAQQAEASRLAVDATEQIVIPLVDANFGANEPCPSITVEDVGIDDQLTAQDLNWLLLAGGLNPDDTLEEDIRKRKHLPPIDHATRRLEIVEQPPPGQTPPAQGEPEK